MKYLLLILALIVPAVASADGLSDMGDQFCRAEVGNDPTARQHCLRDWQRSTYLVRRYYIHAGLMDTKGDQTPFSFADMFENPFVLSPRRVINNCSAGQVWNGNLFSGVMDFRTIWSCIADIDPEAAAWDTI